MTTVASTVTTVEPRMAATRAPFLRDMPASLALLQSAAMARRLLLLGSTGSIGTQALDVVGAHRRPRGRRACRPAARGSRSSPRRREHGVRRIALADADAAARAAEAWTDGEVLAGAEGLVRLVIESERRPRAQRARGLGRPGADDRGAGGGDRPRAGQQGVARRRGRARDAARRGHGRAAAADRLRAHRAAPPPAGRAARRAGAHDDHRLGRPVPRAPARGAGRRDRRARRSRTRRGRWAARSRSTRPRS